MFYKSLGPCNPIDGKQQFSIAECLSLCEDISLQTAASVVITSAKEKKFIFMVTGTKTAVNNATKLVFEKFRPKVQELLVLQKV